MLNEFCPISKTPPSLHPLLLTKNIKMDENANENQMKIHPLLHCISSFEGISLKNVRYSHQIFYYFLLFYIRFYISRLFFHKFLELHSTLSGKKIFITIFPFLSVTLNPNPLTAQIR